MQKVCRAGDSQKVRVGPIISKEAKERILSLIEMESQSSLSS
ncbi:MAG: hypothetical protein CM1200mP12_07190 [Gammaproteobacteria bacterium]|nr:MAG: hypothetical protein CM1200mP12_07190 [Gammaproteobacteria bacterium]